MAAVVVGHLYGGDEGAGRSVRVWTYSWHVPVFFFLAGYLWTPGRPVADIASSRARTLLLPYAAWTVALGVPYFTLMALDGAPVARDVGVTLWGGGLVRGFFAPFWFLPVLFGVAVLRAAVDRVPRPAMWALALAGLGAAYIWGDSMARSPHDLLLVPACLVFVLVGEWVRSAETRSSARRGTLAAVLALVAAGALLASGAAAPLDIKLGDFGTPVTSMVAACLICGGLAVLARRIPLTGRWGARVTELASVSIAVLTTHGFAFAVLGRIGLPHPAVLVSALVGCWALGLALHRTALSPWLLGVTQVGSRRRR